MRQKLDNERALLTAELIEDREEEISYMEQQARDYQQKKIRPQWRLYYSEETTGKTGAGPGICRGAGNSQIEKF